MTVQLCPELAPAIRQASKKTLFERAFAMRQRPALTPLVGALPSTVPFVGPEAQERERGRAFRARIGANESSFGPSPRVIARMEASRVTCGCIATPTITI